MAVPRARACSALWCYTATSPRIPEAAPSPGCSVHSHARLRSLDGAPAHGLTLDGCHRFSRYVLTFDLADAAEAATHLRAQVCALFPGARVQAYRAPVIGTRAHTAPPPPTYCDRPGG